MGRARLGEMQIGQVIVSLFVIMLGLGLGIVSGPAIDQLSGRYWRGVYAALVVALAILYVGFALWGGTGVDVVLAVAAVAGFSFLAGLGVGQSAWWLPAGLVLHAVWNLSYTYGLAHPGLPPGFPMFCMAYCLALAAMLCRRLPRKSA